MVIVSCWVGHQGAAKCFPSGDASSALKATTVVEGGGMLGILLFAANLCGNQHSLAVSGGGIYWGHGINTDPPHWLGSWDAFIVHFWVWERVSTREGFGKKEWGGGLCSGYHDREQAELNVVFSDIFYRITYHPVCGWSNHKFLRHEQNQHCVIVS